MEKQSLNEFKLIEGQFYPDDAKNILLSLFNNKINYHQLESFSDNIRHGKEESVSQSRISALKDSIENIKAMIAEANSNGKQLKIDGLIQITFVEE